MCFYNIFNWNIAQIARFNLGNLKISTESLFLALDSGKCFFFVSNINETTDIHFFAKKKWNSVVKNCEIEEKRVQFGESMHPTTNLFLTLFENTIRIDSLDIIAGGTVFPADFHSYFAFPMLLPIFKSFSFQFSKQFLCFYSCCQRSLLSKLKANADAMTSSFLPIFGAFRRILIEKTS